MLALAPTDVTRHDVADYARSLVAAARSIPDERLHRRRFRVADVVVEARFTDLELAELYPRRIACAPVTDDSARADTRVDVFSCDRLGWPMPARWADADCPRQDFATRLEAAGLDAAFPYHPGLWQVFEPAGAYGVQLCTTRTDLPPWDSGAPLRLHLFWALGARGRHLIHGATLGVDDVGVLLAGPGGAGKSGTTMAGLAAGMRTVGDDYVVVDDTRSRPTAIPIFRVAKLDPVGLARLGTRASALDGQAANWQGKIEFDPARIFATPIAERIELRAVLLPRIARADRTTVTAVSALDAMRALSLANLYQFPARLAATAHFLARLARTLPAFRLDLSADPVEIGATLRGLVARLPRP